MPKEEPATLFQGTPETETGRIGPKGKKGDVKRKKGGGRKSLLLVESRTVPGGVLNLTQRDVRLLGRGEKAIPGGRLHRTTYKGEVVRE